MCTITRSYLILLTFDNETDIPISCQCHPWKRIIKTPLKKNDTNDEKSDANPDDLPVTAPSSKDNPEMEVIVENLPSRKSANDTEEGFIADRTSENEELDVNDENDEQISEFEPESPSSNKSVLVFEAWKQYRQQPINL